MTIGAYLGVAGLVDIGYRFYTATETAVAARVTTGITDAGDGWYSASVTLPATSASVRWDSTGTAEAKAREYWPDPWGHPVPNGYPSGTAGYVLGTNLDATLSSRATPAQVATELTTYGALKPTTAGRTLDVTTTGEAGIDLDNTVGTLAKGTDITGFNDLSAANVQTELTTYGALKPTTAGRTLDVSTGGEAGLDWTNIGAPTTTQTLSGTTIGTATNLTNDPPGVTTLLTRVTATIFTGITSLKEWLGLLAGKQVGNTTARTEIRSSGAGAGTFDETTDSQEALRDRGDVAWLTGAGGDPWATALPGAYGAGTAGNIIGSNLNATVSSRATPAQVQTELGTYGALKPTVPARTLDVSAGGEAGLDWANIGTPATTVALSNTTIGTTTNLTNDPPGVTTLLTRVTSTLFAGITSLKEWLGLLAGKQAGNTTARTELRSSGAGSGTFDEVTDSQEAIRDRGDTAWTTGAGGDPWATAVPGAYGAGTAGNILGNRLDAAVSTRATPAQVATELTTYGAIKPTTAGRTLDVSVAGEAGIDWSNIGAPTTTQNLSATTISTSQTVGSVTNPVTLTAAYDAAKTAATQASVTATPDQVWAKTMTEQASVPSVTASVLAALQWIFLLSRNKITQTSTTQTVRNDGDSATVGTSTVSDNGTQFVRGKFT